MDDFFIEIVYMLFFYIAIPMNSLKIILCKYLYHFALILQNLHFIVVSSIHCNLNNRFIYNMIENKYLYYAILFTIS